MIWLKQSTEITIRVGPFVDATDGVTAETGLATETTEISKNGGVFGTGPVLGTHDAEGFYQYTLDVTDTNTLGSLRAKALDAAHVPFFDDFMVLPATVYAAMVAGTASLPAQVTVIDANAITAAAINADAITAAKIADNAIAAEHLAAGAIDATALATDAIDAASLKTDAVNKIRDSIISDATTFAGADVATIKTQTANVMRALATGTADSGTSTTLTDTARTEANTDYWKGCWLVLTSTTLNGQARKISAFNAGTDVITVDRAFTVAVSTHTYEIWPADFPNNLSALSIETDGAVHADVKEHLGVAVPALIGGRFDSSTGAMASGVVTATAIGVDAITEAKIADDAIASEHLATGAISADTIAANSIDSTALAADAINAASLKTDAVAKIRDAILSDSTSFAGASIAALVTNTTGLPKAAGSGTATSGSSTTLVDTARTEGDTDYWKGCYLLITNGSTSGQTRLITAYNFTTDTFTVDRAFTDAIATNTYQIHGADFPANLALLGIETDGDVHADIKQHLAVAAPALVGGRYDSSTGAMASNVLTEAAINDAALTAAKFAADAITSTVVADNTITAAKINAAALTAAKFAAGAIDANALNADAAAEIADAVADEDIVAAHGTADTLGLLVSELSRRAVTFNTTVVDGSIIGQIADDGTGVYDRTTDSVQAIRDRGDAAWTTGGGSSSPILLQNTTIATLASQTDFTLTAGSADNDAYNGCIIVITDVSTATQKAVGLVTDYVGSTKQVILAEDPNAGFVMVATDVVDVIAAPKQLPNVAHDVAGGLPTGDASGRVDLGSWLGTAPLALSSQRVVSNVGAMDAGVVTAAAIGTAAIDADSIAANAITAVKINAAAITAAKFGLGAIDANAIAADAITEAKIADDAIASEHFATGAISADSVASNAITAAKIATDAITAAKVGAGTIDAATFAADAIDAAALASGAIVAGTFATGAIDANALAADAVDEIKDDLLVFKKNIAVPVFHFLMKDATTGDPKTGLTVTVQRAIDTGTFAGHGGTVTELANGWYRTDFLAADMNGDAIAFKFTATGAKDLGIAVRTKS